MDFDVKMRTSSDSDYYDSYRFFVDNKHHDIKNMDYQLEPIVSVNHSCVYPLYFADMIESKKETISNFFLQNNGLVTLVQLSSAIFCLFAFLIDFAWFWCFLTIQLLIFFTQIIQYYIKKDFLFDDNRQYLLTYAKHRSLEQQNYRYVALDQKVFYGLQDEQECNKIIHSMEYFYVFLKEFCDRVDSQLHHFCCVQDIEEEKLNTVNQSNQYQLVLSQSMYRFNNDVAVVVMNDDMVYQENSVMNKKSMCLSLSPHSVLEGIYSSDMYFFKTLLRSEKYLQACYLFYSNMIKTVYQIDELMESAVLYALIKLSNGTYMIYPVFIGLAMN